MKCHDTINTEINVHENVCFVFLVLAFFVPISFSTRCMLALRDWSRETNVDLIKVQQQTVQADRQALISWSTASIRVFDPMCSPPGEDCGCIWMCTSEQTWDYHHTTSTERRQIKGNTVAFATHMHLCMSQQNISTIWLNLSPAEERLSAGWTKPALTYCWQNSLTSVIDDAVDQPSCTTLGQEEALMELPSCEKSQKRNCYWWSMHSLGSLTFASVIVLHKHQRSADTTMECKQSGPCPWWLCH